MKLLIIGGSGFVSKRVLIAAVDAGHELWYLTRGLHEHIPGAVPLLADRNNKMQLYSALKSAQQHWDAVIDCICFNREQAEIGIEIFSEFTERIVLISTDSVYSPDSKKMPQDENGASYMSGDNYGARKRLMEKAYIDCCPSSLKWTIFRPLHMIGPGSELGCFPENTRRKDLLQALINGEKIKLVGGGRYCIQPLYVDDLAKAMLACINNCKTYNEIFCIAGPDYVSNRNYFELLGELLNINVYIEETDELEYAACHPDSYIYLCNRVYDLTKLKSTGLPVPQTGVREGLKKQVDYLLNMSNKENSK